MSSSSDDDNSPTEKVARTPGDDHPLSPASSSVSSSADRAPAQSAAKSSSEDDAKPAAAYASSSDDDGTVKPVPVATLQQSMFGADVSSSDEADSDDERVNDKLPQKKKAIAADSDDDSGNDATIANKSKAAASSDAEAAKSDDAVGEDESAVAEEEPEPEPIFVEVPPKDVHLGGEAYHVKLPNFLTVVTQQFDADYYEQENEDEDLLDEEGRARLKLRCENSIRWRKVVDADGNEVKQSNAKFVRWSDGSMTLHLGAEMFEVAVLPVHDHSHLFLRQGAGLEGQAIFKSKMTFRPHSTDTLTHRKMTINMAERSNKTQKTKMFSIPDSEKDPEKSKVDMVRREEERLRASLRRDNTQRRIRERGAYGALSTSYLEPDMSGDEAENVGAIKRQFRQTSGAVLRGEIGEYSSARYADDDAGAQRLERAKRIVSDDEDNASDRDESTAKEPPPSADRKRRVIEDDDEESN